MVQVGQWPALPVTPDLIVVALSPADDPVLELAQLQVYQGEGGPRPATVVGKSPDSQLLLVRCAGHGCAPWGLAKPPQEGDDFYAGGFVPNEDGLCKFKLRTLGYNELLARPTSNAQVAMELASYRGGLLLTQAGAVWGFMVSPPIGPLPATWVGAEGITDLVRAHEPNFARAPINQDDVNAMKEKPIYLVATVDMRDQPLFPGGEAFGSIDVTTQHVGDYRCLACTGARVLTCPSKTCVRGLVRRPYFYFVPNPTGAGPGVRRTAYEMVDCPNCSDGIVDCPMCEDGSNR
jgi:hypothetical protein